MPEFDPPPLFENALKIKSKGKFCHQAKILKSTPSTKSGGGLIRPPAFLRKQEGGLIKGVINVFRYPDAGKKD